MEQVLKNFSLNYPDRFFDVGIAEQHALGLAAGLATQGMIPVVPIYSSFLQRAYDQVIHDIAIEKLPVVLCVDRAGIVGNDGETHQGLLDMAFFNIVPNLTIMAPKDFKELEQMLEYAIYASRPIAIRYPRGSEDEYKFDKHEKIEFGKSELLCEGNDITIIAIGKMVAKAMKLREMLLAENIKADVINARFLKPLDLDNILKSVNKTKKVVTIEDGTIKGGLGEQIKLIAKDCEVLNFAYPDEFIKHGTIYEIEKQYGLEVEQMYNKCKKAGLLNKNEKELIKI